MRRVMVINSSTNGKKESSALAATENANVCTSVRNKYFTVEIINPGAGECPAAEAAWTPTGFDRWDGLRTIKLMLSETCRRPHSRSGGTVRRVSELELSLSFHDFGHELQGVENFSSCHLQSS